MFASGNNQASSSEGMNFACALIQWCQATGNTAVRDAGIYIYTTQSAAIADYWFDVDNDAFPAQFRQHRRDGAGVAAPTPPGSPPIRRRSRAPPASDHRQPPLPGPAPELQQDQLRRGGPRPGGEPIAWQDILWEFCSGDPDLALSKSEPTRASPPKRANPSAHVPLDPQPRRAGQRDAASPPTTRSAAVFTKNGQRSYVVVNISSAALTVTFSNGTKVTAPAGKTVVPAPSPGAVAMPRPHRGRIRPRPRPHPDPHTTPTPTPTPTATPTHPDAHADADADTLPTPTAPTQPGRGLPRAPMASSATARPPSARFSWPRRTASATGRRKGQVFTATGVTQAWTGASGAFDLAVDVGNGGRQWEPGPDLLRPDWNGSFDRVETYRYFATDPVVGDEHYTQDRQLLSATGTIGAPESRHGQGRGVERIGNQPSTLGVGSLSRLDLPLRCPGRGPDPMGCALLTAPTGRSPDPVVARHRSSESTRRDSRWVLLGRAPPDRPSPGDRRTRIGGDSDRSTTRRAMADYALPICPTTTGHCAAHLRRDHGAAPRQAPCHLRQGV